MMPSRTIAIPAARPLPKSSPLGEPGDDVEAEGAGADEGADDDHREDQDDALVRREQQRRAGTSGNWTFQSSWRSVEPAAVAASMTVVETARMPASTSRMTGGAA